MIGALIGAGSSLLGGWLQSRAASQAAEQQMRAAREVGDRARALSGDAAGYVANAGESAAAGVEGALNRGTERIDDGTAAANSLLRGVYQEAQGNYNPYLTAGQQGVDALTGMLDPSQNFQFSQDDPSYQFRMQQGQQALERSAAARGGALGGGAVRSAMRYGQDFASTEYQKAFDRYMKERESRMSAANTLYAGGLGAANGMTQAGQNFGNQSSSNIMQGATTGAALGVDGMRAAGGFRYGASVDAGNMRINGEQIAGNAITGGANAQAAGTIGSANAWSNALGGVSNAVLMESILRRTQPTQPQTNGFNSGGSGF
jgi:hypothetical protein